MGRPDSLFKLAVLYLVLTIPLSIAYPDLRKFIISIALILFIVDIKNWKAKDSIIFNALILGFVLTEIYKTVYPTYLENSLTWFLASAPLAAYIIWKFRAWDVKRFPNIFDEDVKILKEVFWKLVGILELSGGKIPHRKIAIGIIAGLAFAIANFFFTSLVLKNPLTQNPPLISYFTVYTITLAPFIEELIFRWYLINRFESVYGNGIHGKLGGILSSIIVFTWAHDPAPLNRLLPSIGYTLVYVWGWKKNLIGSMFAHSSYNGLINYVDDIFK